MNPHRSAQASADSTRPPISAFLIVCSSALAILLLGLPLIALALRAVERQAWEAAPDSGVSEALFLSLLTTTCTALLTLAFGTPLAYALARWRFPLRRVLQTLVELPIVLPPAVAGLALLLAFGRRGLLGPGLDSIGVSLPFTTAAVVLAQLFVAAPFYIRAAQAGFAAIDPDIEDAARVDGAHDLALLRYITIPLAARSIGAGLSLSWARALGEFGATILFAGSLSGRTQTMPLLVYNILERDLNAAIWTGLLLVLLAAAALLLARWVNPEN